MLYEAIYVMFKDRENESVAAEVSGGRTAGIHFLVRQEYSVSWSCGWLHRGLRM